MYSLFLEFFVATSGWNNFFLGFSSYQTRLRSKEGLNMDGGKQIDQSTDEKNVHSGIGALAEKNMTAPHPALTTCLLLWVMVHLLKVYLNFKYES